MKRLFSLGLHRPRDAARDADAELGALMDEQVAHLVARGMSPDAARLEASRRVGTQNLHRSAEQRERRLRLTEWLEELRNDLRFAARSLSRSPGLALGAILTLALAIGANTAIYSAVNAVLLRKLPVAQSDRLAMLWESNPDFGWDKQDAAPANMFDWKEQVTGFADVTAYEHFASSVTLTGFGEPRLLKSQSAMGNFFDLLGVVPVLGRSFREAETWAEGSQRIVILTNRVWSEVFAADPRIIGRSVRLNGRDTEVVGVLPASFALPGVEAEVWFPTRWDQASRSRGFFRRAHWIHPIARLKPGVTFENADRELRTVMKRLEQQYPATNTHMGAGLTPLHDFLIGSARLPLIVMFSAVAVLLLIACANIANLLLVRAGGQEREAALRLALGAGRGRLLRRALSETVILSGIGGALGLLLGWWGTKTLVALQPAGILPVRQVPFGWSVLLYGFGAIVIAAGLFSLAPVLWTARRAPSDVLRDESRSASTGLRARRWGEVLLVGQVTLALALSLGAGLLVRSYLRLQRVDPGFDPRGVLAVEIGLPGFRYDSVRKVLAFYQELEERVGGQPGVEAVAIVSGVPLGPPMWTSQLAIRGQAPVEGQIHHREISPDYQRVMKVPLRRGRVFTSADGAGAPYVVLVNEALARRYFPNRDPIGEQIAFDKIPDSTSTWRTIVGVVGDERIGSLSAVPEPEVLAPFPQEPRNGMTLVVRTGDPAGLGPSVRRIVKAIEPSLAITSMQTMEDVRAVALARDRFMTVLLLSFAGVGILLGIVGIYGVVSQLARRRTREMGIRIALGSDTRQVQWLVLRRGLWLTGLGILGGVSLAVGLTGAIRTLLYQVTPLDPITFALVPVLVLLTAMLASWLPARRASRADPCECLRSD